jgi:hypothetical protein
MRAGYDCYDCYDGSKRSKGSKVLFAAVRFFVSSVGFAAILLKNSIFGVGSKISGL